MYDLATATARYPADRPGRAHVWRQQIAPGAAVLDVRVTAPRTLRKWERVEARPTPPADDTRLVRSQRPIARDADARQQQVGETRRRPPGSTSNLGEGTDAESFVKPVDWHRATA